QLAQLRIRAAVPELGISIVRVDRALRDPCTLAAWSEALRSDSIRAAVARIPMGLPVPPGFAHAAEDFYVLALDAVPPCARAARPGRSAITRESSGTARRRLPAPPTRSP